MRSATSCDWKLKGKGKFLFQLYGTNFDALMPISYSTLIGKNQVRRTLAPYQAATSI